MANPMMDPMAAGPMDAENPAEQAGEPTKSVTISQLPSGGFAVNDQPAANIDEALDLARQLLQDDGGAEAQMMKGYQKGAPAPGKPSVGKVFGE